MLWPLKILGLFFLCPGSLEGLECHGQTSNIKKGRASWPHCLLGLPSSCGHSFPSLLLTCRSLKGQGCGCGKGVLRNPFSHILPRFFGWEE